MSYLGFYIKLYDNRPGLNTIDDNTFVNEKIIVDYNKIGEIINGNPDEYVAIMTFGYRDDKIVFSKLMDKEFFYIGMIGSEAKIKTLFTEFQEEGIDPERWKHVFIPIGLNIFSKTAKEIAVSIAAEIIREKNKYLPTGRTFQ
jgi:xanthine dehydrogenase accessory factor